MLRTTERYVPTTAVQCSRLDDATVLTATHTGERWTLSPAGEEVWAMLHADRQTLDRLVMGFARRSSGQALTQVPDVVLAELDSFVRRGFVQRVANA